jgi:hypothetical protein
MSTAQHSRIAVTATFVTNLVACVHISGDVDMAAEDDLARVMTHLYMRRCRTVYIDLAAVTFAGTTLLTFIAGVYAGDRGRYGGWVAEVDEIGDERHTITTGPRPIAPHTTPETLSADADALVSAPEHQARRGGGGPGVRSRPGSGGRG